MVSPREMHSLRFAPLKSASLPLRRLASRVQYTFDRATTGGVPWQAAMKSARRAAYLTHIMTGVLEFIRFAPKGTQAVHTMLLKAAVNLEKGGDLGIFSPMYLIVMRKPTIQNVASRGHP